MPHAWNAEDAAREETQAIWAGPVERRLLRDLLERFSGPIKLLDLPAIGGARTVARVKNLPVTVTAVDDNVQALAVAASKGLHTVHGAIGDAHLDELGTFDVVWCSSIHHEPNLLSALKGLWKLVAPGGALVVVVPEDDFNEAEPCGPALRHLLSDLSGVDGVSRRHDANAIAAAAVQLDPAVIARRVPPRRQAPPLPATVEAMTTWRVERLKTAGETDWAELASHEIGDLMVAAGYGRGMVAAADIATLIWRSTAP